MVMRRTWTAGEAEKSCARAQRGSACDVPREGLRLVDIIKFCLQYCISGFNAIPKAFIDKTNVRLLVNMRLTLGMHFTSQQTPGA
jgi:hypothetical protein